MVPHRPLEQVLTRAQKAGTAHSLFIRGEGRGEKSEGVRYLNEPG